MVLASGESWTLRLITGFRVIINSFCAQLWESITNQVMLFVLTLQPVLFAILSIELYRFGGKSSLTLYALISSGMIRVRNANLWTSGFIITNERRAGTLELLFASPSALMLVFLGKSLTNASLSLLFVLAAWSF
jgi:ABC-type transport system involved in cytochrome c biogenesis permease component